MKKVNRGLTEMTQFHPVYRVVLVAATLCVGATVSMHAQTYDGKPLTSWIQQLSDADPATQLNAAKAIGAIGAAGATRSVPALTGVVKRPALPLQRARVYHFTTVELGGDETEIDVEAAVQAAAVKALGEIGPASAPAIPALIALFGRDRTTAGSSGLPKDLATLDTGDVSAIKKMLAVTMGDLVVSSATSETLAAIGKAEVKPLIAALSSPNDNRRSGAARALGEMGAEALVAVPALQKVADTDSFKGARDNATRAIARIQ